VAGGSSGGVVRLWAGPAVRSLTWRSVQTLRAHDGRVTATALGPPGLLATAGEDGSVKLWSLRPVRALRTLPGGGQVRTLSFARDGRRLLAGGQDGTIRVWPVPQPAAANAI
jgi:WD40 repeat protein